MAREISIYVQHRPQKDGYELNIQVYDRFENRTQGLNHSLEWIDVPEGARGPYGPIITEDAAQRLVNSLWAAGVRPSSTKESSTALEATKYHLEDMRRLAFSGFVTLGVSEE